MSTWQDMSVSSVFGRTGAIVGLESDYAIM